MLFGQMLGLADDLLQDLYYVALLCWASYPAAFQRCAAPRAVSWSGAPLERLAIWNGAGIMQLFWETMDADDIVLTHARHQTEASTLQGRCSGALPALCTAAQVAGSLGLREQISHALGQMLERWDGCGAPDPAFHDALALVARVAQIALDAELFERLGGAELAITLVRRCAGMVYDPGLAASFCRAAHELFPAMECDSMWEVVLATEPGAQPRLTGAAFEAALEVIGDVADVHARGITGQARTVAALAAGAAHCCALPDADITALRYAGLVQDIGMIASAPAFHESSARRSEVEQERMRLHPYYTERILSRTRSLAPIGALASLHHERLDGSGYYRGLSAAQLPLTGRILAAADVYATLTEAQLQDSATTSATAAEELRKEVRAGQLDGEAVSAVLTAAGQRIRRRLHTRIAGLMNREIEVLRLLSEGLVNHQMAASLGISAHTVDHHIRHIYDKIDATSRAVAVRFAMQYQILGPAEDDGSRFRAKK